MQVDSKVWLGLAGPIALGAVLGLGAGVRTMLTQSVLLPCLIVGLTLSLVPALYIGLSLTGSAPPPWKGAAVVAKALVASGIVMAGLSPAVSFLVVSASARGYDRDLGFLVAGSAALVGMRQLASGLLESTPRRERSMLVFAAWSLVALSLGADLLGSVLGRAS